MKKIITFVFIALLAAGCAKDNIPNQGQQDDTITVGAFLSLTGQWATLGKTSEAALDLATKEINNYFQSGGSQTRVAVKIYDTKLDAATALDALKEAHKQGIRFIIGPQSSGECSQLLDYANKNNMIIISQGSTAGALSIPGDNLFRYCPDEKLETAAEAKAIFSDGIRAIVTIALDDVGNKGLQQSLDNAFGTLGGQVYSLNPYAANTTDFSSVISDINGQLTAAINQYGADKVGVYIACFDEGVNLFAQAVNDTVLTSVNWYGGDGIANSEALAANSTAAAFALSTHFTTPAFALSDDAKSIWKSLSDKILQKTGIQPTAFGLASYDALWTVALTYEATQGDGHSWDNAKKMFAKQSDMYFGATGATKLNANGDRALASFGFWEMIQDNNGYSWKLMRIVTP